MAESPSNPENQSMKSVPQADHPDSQVMPALKHFTKSNLLNTCQVDVNGVEDAHVEGKRVLGMERCCVLFVDRADDTWQQQLDLKRLESILHAESARCLYASSYEHAIEIAKQVAIDLIVVDPALHSSQKIEEQASHVSFESFCQSVKSEEGGAEMLILTRQRNFENLLHWMRLGAADCLVLPDDVRTSSDLLLDRLAILWRKRLRERRGVMASRQLVRKCEKLADSKREVQEELKTVCKKMTAKYEALASQLSKVAMESEFTATVQNELEIESLLRKTLGFLLDKAGAINAVIFLPIANMNPDAEEKLHYALGGYLESVEGGLEISTLQLMSQNLAPAIAKRKKPLHLTDDTKTQAWLGTDRLNGQHTYAIASSDESDVLAILVMTRQNGDPFLTVEVEAFECVANLLGGFLARLLRVHHRLNLNHLQVLESADAIEKEELMITEEVILEPIEEDIEGAEDMLIDEFIEEMDPIMEDDIEDESSLDGLSMEAIENLDDVMSQTEASIQEIDELLQSTDLSQSQQDDLDLPASDEISADEEKIKPRKPVKPEKLSDGLYDDRKRYLQD